MILLFSIFYLNLFVQVFSYTNNSCYIKNFNTKHRCYYVNDPKCFYEHFDLTPEQKNYTFDPFGGYEHQQQFVDILNQARNNYSHYRSLKNMTVVSYSEKLEYLSKYYNMFSINAKKCYVLTDKTNIVTLPRRIYNYMIIRESKEILHIGYINDLIRNNQNILFFPLLNEIGCIDTINSNIIYTQCIANFADSIQHKDAQGFPYSNCKISDSEVNSVAYDNLCGYSGPRGTKGEIGELGIKGNNYFKPKLAEHGNAGNTGSNGDIGEIGLKGLKGDTGSSGDQGYAPIAIPQSKKGAIGSIGSSGDKGESVIRGAKGSTGSVGAKYPYPSKLFYEQYEFWIFYLILWSGLAINMIIFMKKSKKLQGTYYIPMENDINNVNSVVEKDLITFKGITDNHLQETGVDGDDFFL